MDGRRERHAGAVQGRWVQQGQKGLHASAGACATVLTTAVARSELGCGCGGAVSEGCAWSTASGERMQSKNDLGVSALDAASTTLLPMQPHAPGASATMRVLVLAAEAGTLLGMACVGQPSNSTMREPAPAVGTKHDPSCAAPAAVGPSPCAANKALLSHALAPGTCQQPGCCASSGLATSCGTYTRPGGVVSIDIEVHTQMGFPISPSRAQSPSAGAHLFATTIECVLGCDRCREWPGIAQGRASSSRARCGGMNRTGKGGTESDLCLAMAMAVAVVFPCLLGASAEGVVHEDSMPAAAQNSASGTTQRELALSAGILQLHAAPAHSITPRCPHQHGGAMGSPPWASCSFHRTPLPRVPPARILPHTLGGG